MFRRIQRQYGLSTPIRPTFQVLTQPTDHLTLCAIGGQKSLLVPMNRAMIGAGIVGGRVYVAELPVGDDDDNVRGGEKKEVVGAAVWFPPGNAFLAS